MKQHLNPQITVSINEAAGLIGVSTATLRNWEKAGLIFPQRGDNNYRNFTMADIEHLHLVYDYSVNQKMSLSAISSLLNKNHIQRKNMKDDTVSQRMLSEKWREHRQKKGLSIVDVAKEIGISPSYLSKIESAKTNVSFDILQRLAAYYGENILYYYEQEEKAVPVTRNKPGEEFTIGLEGVTLSSLSTLRNAHMKVMTYTISPLCGRMEATAHHGEEFIYVLEGKVEFVLREQDTFLLNQGDSLHYSSGEKHRWRNPSEHKIAKMLWTYTLAETN